MQHPPKISIVVPSFNQGKYLEETILSILGQDYPNTEIILIDGGSTDESIDVIRRYEKHYKYWVSEPDNGQSHAINKGLEYATGDIFDWMNSDDVIAPGTFWKVAEAYLQNPEAYVVCGYMTCFKDGIFEKPVRMKIFDRLEDTMIFGSMSGPSMYFRLDKFKALGPLSEILHYCFDLEIWFRFIEAYGLKRFTFVEANFCYFRLHASSKTVSQFANFAEDGYQIHCSILDATNEKRQVRIAPEDLKISLKYSNNWKFTGINLRIFSALAIQRHLETLHQRLSFFQIMKWFCISLYLAPSKRFTRFYMLPLRAIRWKILFHLKYKLE